MSRGAVVHLFFYFLSGKLLFTRVAKPSSIFFSAPRISLSKSAFVQKSWQNWSCKFFPTDESYSFRPVSEELKLTVSSSNLLVRSAV